MRVDEAGQDQVRAVVAGDDGLLASAAPGTIITVHSTISPETAIALAEQCAAKGVTLFDSRLHYRKDFYKATPLGRTASETEPDSKAAAELRASYAEAKRLSGFTTKPVSEAA